MFDRFKSWRKHEEKGVECPLCQQRNPEGSESCSRCSYELAKPSHQQDASIDDEAATDLFDQLIDDLEDDDDEEIVDWSNAAFTMDDVTIDVEQYGDGDAIKLSDNPTFAMTVDNPNPVEKDDEKDYELTSADAPKFVTKFEVPETELKPLEEVKSQKIELVQPTATAPKTVAVVATDQISDSNGDVLVKEKVSETHPEEPKQTVEQQATPEPEEQVEEISEEESLLALKKVELVEIASEKDLPISGTKAEIVSRILERDSATADEAAPEPAPTPPPPIAVPSTPAGLPVPPPVSARPVDPMDAAFDGEPPEIPLADAKSVMDMPTPPKIPKIPKLPHIKEANSAKEDSHSNGFWPWPQQEEWSNRDVAMKIKEAMEAAKSQNMAQSTVLLDEVGPHLGDRTKLLYPVGALLQRIGRPSAVDRMLEAAIQSAPDDSHVQTAKAKLRP